MIDTVPVIKLSGIDYPVYSVDFESGGENGPSTIEVQYVNAEGEYTPPELNTNKPVTLEIGNFFNFIGYPVSYNIREGVGGNTLSVKYVDLSIILDKYYVGLKSKFGKGFEAKERGSFDNVILVGRQVDICSDIEEADFYDPWSPCQNNRGEYTKKKVDCQESARRKILDVVYSFDELLNKIKEFILIDALPEAMNFNYYARHTGTLRQVLRRWCDDYGFTFVWDIDESTGNGKLVFVDLRDGINIDDDGIVRDDGYCNLLEKDTSFSIESNVNRGLILYFGKDSEIREYRCGAGAGRRLSLRPLTIHDVFYIREGEDPPLGAASAPNAATQVYGKPPVLDPEIKQYYRKADGDTDAQILSTFSALAALANYSSALRDLYVLYYHAQITDDSKASDSIGGTAIHLLGNMEIKGVLSKNSTDEVDKDTYNKLLSLFEEKEKLEFIEKNGYFVAADKSEEIHKKCYDLEHGIGSDFMGKYWLRYFSDTSNQTPRISAPDGSPRYFTNGEEFQLPFLDLLPSSTKAGKSIFSDIIRRQGDGTVANDYFIMMERAPAWYPAPNSPKIIDLLQDISKFQIAEIGQDSVSQYLKTKDAQNFYIFYPKPDNFSIEGPVEGVDNPIDRENVDIRTTVNGFNTSFGLRQAHCVKYKITSESGELEIYTPSQSYDFGERGGGYVVIVDNNEAVIRNTSIKMEKVLGLVKEDITGKTVGSDILYRDVTQNIFKILKYHTDDDRAYAPNKLDYNEDYIDELMDEFLKGLASKPVIDTKVIRYTLGGFPVVYKTISDGLASFNIRYGGKEGVTSYITFTNRPKVEKSESLIIKEIEKNNTIFNLLSKQQVANQMSMPLANIPVGVEEISE